MPQFTPVKSSNLSHIAYSPRQNALYVRFKDGGVYRYGNVPMALYNAFREAKSKGKFLVDQIIPFFDAEQTQDAYEEEEEYDDHGIPKTEHPNCKGKHEPIHVDELKHLKHASADSYVKEKPVIRTGRIEL